MAANKEELIQVEGVVAKVLPATMYKVRLENDHEILAHISGKMRKHFIRITTGDKVKVEMSPLRSNQGPHRLPSPQLAPPLEFLQNCCSLYV